MHTSKAFFFVPWVVLACVWCAMRPALAQLTPVNSPPPAVPVVRFAPEKDYGPFVFQDAQGRLQGLSVDVLRAMEPSMRVRIETQPARALADILQLARQGQVDLISSLRPTPERAEFLRFTPPYVQVPAVLVVRRGSNPPGLEHLTGKSVAVGAGYAVEPFVRERYPLVRWHSVPDDTVALRDLQSGQLDGVVADLASVGFAVRSQGLSGLQISTQVGFIYSLSFAYRKDWPGLGEQLLAGLDALGPEQREAIIRPWLELPELSFEDSAQRWGRQLGLMLLAISLVWLVVVTRRMQRGQT